ncbi:MAG: AzlC family ABC transporter permease [Oscillospiraceae bacterium]|nr:AzlC family ABC transporter permease [Oscillospiraceae bacterium]
MLNNTYSLKSQHNKAAFAEGVKDGVPIALAYLAVSFSLGIAAKNVGFTPWQGFVVSTLCAASAGEYIGFTMVAAGATLMETAIATLITNARYLLMSCAMSQRTDPKMPFFHRIFIGQFITDELFGIAIARKGMINPFYSYGAFLVAIPAWSFGTALGVVAGNIMPISLASAFSVALYGMFIAIIIAPARKDKAVALVVVASFILSSIGAYLPLFAGIAEGTKTMVVTVAVATVAAILFPHNDEEEAE